jgi:hypothetical protein
MDSAEYLASAMTEDLFAHVRFSKAIAPTRLRTRVPE